MFTERKWAALKKAHITCLDYSMDMLEQAEKRLSGYPHIKCVQGDVGNLQMGDESFDIVVSMNGFHAFPDKQKAFRETWRVLKPGGDYRLLLYQGKIQTSRLACEKHSCKEGLVLSPIPDGGRAERYFAENV